MFSLSSKSVIAFGGSRSFHFSDEVFKVVEKVVASAASVRVGCALGADELVIKLVLGLQAAKKLTVCAVFDRASRGSWRDSAVQSVLLAEAMSASVLWCSGGGLQVPLIARLARRSRAVISGSSAFVLFLSPGVSSSSGSCSAASFAVSSGVPVFAFSAEVPPALSVAGRWVASSFAGQSCWWFSPDQLRFFAQS